MSSIVEKSKPFGFRVDIWQHQNRRRSKEPLPMPTKRPSPKPQSSRATLTIPELEHAKAAALGTLVSLHSRRAYKNAIDRFITWYCSEPRLGFNRAVVLRYRSFLESLSLSAATINLHLSAIRRLADEAAEISMLSPELAIGIRRVKGVKRLGRRIGNWLTGDQAQNLLTSIPQSTLRGRRDAALIGLLLGCGLRRSEAVALRFDQIQLREDHWVVADLYGKGGRLRSVPVPIWCKTLIDRWLRTSGVTGGLVFRRIWKNRTELSCEVAPDVVWTTVKRYAKQIGVDHLAPHDLRRTCARLCHGAGGELEQIQFLLGHASVQTTERYIGCRQKFKNAVNDRLQISLTSRA
jgi:integrase